MADKMKKEHVETESFENSSEEDYCEEEEGQFHSGPQILRKTESFSLCEVRKELKRRKKRFSRTTPEEKELSLKAFELEVSNLEEKKLDNLILKMLNDIPTGKKKGTWKKGHEHCMNGKDICTWIELNLKLKEEEAIQEGQTLFMNRGVFYSVSKKHISFHKSPDVYYRFKIFDNLEERTECLNRSKRYIEEAGEPGPLSQQLVSSLIDILKNRVKSDGSVDFSSAKESTEFKKFNLQVCELQNVDFGHLRNSEKTVFWINVYNLLYLHAYTCFGEPKSLLEKKSILSKNYDIGGHQYSLEMLHLILRGKPSELSPDLPTRELQITPNPFVHFCIFNGSNCSPTIRAYAPTDFGSKLVVSQFAKDFLETHVTINTDLDEVWLPKMFRDYSLDFGENDKEILSQISEFIESKRDYILRYLASIEVKYKENAYDNIQYFKNAAH